MNSTAAVRTVTRIEANPLLVKSAKEFTKKKVAPYCRVSTDQEDQLNSYEAQITYYTEKIAKNPEWTFVGIYADEGISGTRTDRRKDFLRLMRDCQKGKVDYILTKSISRFARNTVDSLLWTRKLRAIGVGVYFEEQALDSLKAENETLIGIFSVLAQSESENISANVKWGVRQSMKSGTYCTNFNCFGYRKGDNGIPVIVPEEAEIIKRIFQKILDGNSILQIKRFLQENHYKTYNGKSEWTFSGINTIITNEKYVGDVLLQKTFITNCISKKVKVNRGELPKYLVSNNHPPIIDRDTFNLVQLEMANRSNKRSKSTSAITAHGKYSGKYALSDLLVCGSCGSHYKRLGKTAKDGSRVIYWRCINRIEHGKKFCKESIGIEEKQLQAAICRCLSQMMTNREDVIALVESNLKYALTGNDKILDSFAIESQIENYQGQIDTLMKRADETTGNPEVYEREIIKLYEKISALRTQLTTSCHQAAVNEDAEKEMKRIMNTICNYGSESFTEYDDTTVRRLIECVTVMPNKKIAVILKGGFKAEEMI